MLGDFPNQYQDMPLDFFSDKFYEKRKSLFDNKIKELLHADIKERFCVSYKKHFQAPCRPIENWGKFPMEDYLIAIEKIESDKLLKILERLAKDFNNNRAGLPDLFVYSEDEYFFAEVKGEKDKISERQRFWHSYLADELGDKVEIVIVNNEGKKINTEIKSKQVNISFGKSTSKKRKDAIAFIKKQFTFQQFQEKGDDIYSATFDIADIENLYQILDLTSGWKTQKIEIDGERWKSTDLREALWCFREKEQKKKSMDYCLTNEWDGKKNKFQCRNFYFQELENDFWDNYGFIDTQKGEWIFDKKAIQEETQKQINKLTLCPLFSDKRILSFLQAIPETINPKTNNKWGFIDNDRNIWFWKNQKWNSIWGDNPFPGISIMIGVKKLEKEDTHYLDHSSTININVGELIDQNSTQKRGKKEWYKTWWGILLIIFLIIIFLKSL